jgi:hypothetical protein
MAQRGSVPNLMQAAQTAAWEQLWRLLLAQAAEGLAGEPIVREQQRELDWAQARRTNENAAGCNPTASVEVCDAGAPPSN